MINHRVDGFAYVLLKQFLRVMIARDLVNEGLDQAAVRQVSRV
jgi:hypothetical protein